jgi:hypothetical protein
MDKTTHYTFTFEMDEYELDKFTKELNELFETNNWWRGKDPAAAVKLDYTAELYNTLIGVFDE